MQRRDETPAKRLERLHEVWPDADPADLTWIEPIGSRHDALCFDRKTGRVTTGSIGSSSRACFEGDLDAFAAQVERIHEQRMQGADDVPYRERQLGYLSDYRAAVALFRALARSPG